MRILLVALCFMQCSFFSFAKTDCFFKLSGVVMDSINSNPVNFAIVYLTDEDNVLISSDTTNALGEFNFDSLCVGKYTVVMMNYDYYIKNQSLVLNKNTSVNLFLSPRTELLDEVVITSERMKHTHTSSEVHLSKDLIDRYSEASIGRALTNIPGVNVMSLGNNIEKPVIHGLHSSRVPMLNNGVRQEDQEWGVEHAPNIDINAINNLSVIKGAGALEFSGDAIGGVVIANSKSIYPNSSWQGQVISSLSSNGKGANLSLSTQKGFHNGIELYLQASAKKLGDNTAPKYVLSNSGVNEFAGSGKLNYSKNKWRINTYFSAFNTEIGIPKAAHIGNLENLLAAINSREPLIIEKFSYKIKAPKQEIQHILSKVNVEYKSDIGKFDLTYAIQVNNRKEYDVRVGKYKDKPSMDLHLTTHDLMLSLKHKPIGILNGKLGLSGSFQDNYTARGTGSRPLIPNYLKTNLGAYVVENVVLSDKYTLEFGVRYDFQHLDVIKLYRKSRWRKLGYDTKFPNFVIDDTGLNYLTNPKFSYNGFAGTLGLKCETFRNSELLLNYSFSSRMPNPSELFSDGLHHSSAAIEIGDMELKNEKSHKLLIDQNANFLNKRLDADLTLYVNYINDFINQLPRGAEYTIRGAYPVWHYEKTNAFITGADFSLSYLITKDFSYFTSFSYVFGQDLKENLPLINMPAPKFSNTIEYRKEEWNGFFINIGSNLFFKQNRFPDMNFIVEVSENNKLKKEILDISTPPNSAFLIDMQAGVSFDFKNKQEVNLSLAVYNVFNSSYRDYLNRLRYFTDNIGRNIVIKIQYNY